MYSFKKEFDEYCSSFDLKFQDLNAPRLPDDQLIYETDLINQLVAILHHLTVISISVGEDAFNSEYKHVVEKYHRVEKFLKMNSAMTSRRSQAHIEAKYRAARLSTEKALQSKNASERDSLMENVIFIYNELLMFYEKLVETDLNIDSSAVLISKIQELRWVREHCLKLRTSASGFGGLD